MFTVSSLDFHITNVCNFNCQGCDRFNDLPFAGHQRWEDYRDTYHKWSVVLHTKKWTVLGGEPMTNRDYLDWVQGIHQFWPQSQGYLLTNGHYLTPEHRDLYDVISQSRGRIRLQIGLHNLRRKDTILSTVRSWLQGTVSESRWPPDINDIPNFSDNWRQSYQRIRDPAWPDCDTVDQWSSLPAHIQQECERIHGFTPDGLADSRRGWLLQDSNGVIVEIDPENYFRPNAISRRHGSRLTLHDSDPDQAHAVCTYAQNQCYQMIHGLLYKCAPVALFPELDSQFNVELTDQDRDLINSYRPACVDHGTETLAAFLHGIDGVIPQCKFCPSSSTAQEIQSAHAQKISITKR